VLIPTTLEVVEEDVDLTMALTFLEVRAEAVMGQEV
jgi:hypothetical protein